MDTVPGPDSVRLDRGARDGPRRPLGRARLTDLKDLTAGSDLTLEDAGEHELKGVPDRWHLYRMMSGQS